MPEVVGLAASFGPPGPDWDQGDIVDAVYFAAIDKQMPAVLVTPSCDVEQGKVELWTFIALFPDVEVARAVVAKDVEQWNAGGVFSSKQRASLGKALDGLIKQRLPRYHWTPVAVGDSPAQVADFSCVSALPVAEVKTTATRLATLRSSWREQLPARYASFMARVGTVDFKEAEIALAVDRLVKAIV